MESMPFICRRLATLATGVVVLLLITAGTCHDHQQQQQQQQPNRRSETTGDNVQQWPLETDGMQREWDELLYHCRGLVPPRSTRRLGSEFLGKRSPASNDGSLTDAAIQFCSDEFSQNHWLCTCLFPTDSSELGDEPQSGELSAPPAKRGLGAILLSGKRMNKQWSNAMNRRVMGSEFLGKRASPLGSEFLGKRARPLGSEFLGKRSVIPPSVGIAYNY